MTVGQLVHAGNTSIDNSSSDTKSVVTLLNQTDETIQTGLTQGVTLTSPQVSANFVAAANSDGPMSGLLTPAVDSCVS